MTDRAQRPAFEEAPGASSLDVLAIVVVYQRRLEQVDAWPALLAALSSAPEPDHLRLTRVLVYDNSTPPMIAASGLPAGVDLLHDASNGGTVAAFEAAAVQARAGGIGWLLMVDHDTLLPADLLQRAHQALCRVAPHRPGAVLPRVFHGTQPVSPARLTWTGGIRPLRVGEAVGVEQPLTGIASGALVRVEALADLPPIPRSLWLDYFDHWLFLHLRQAGHAQVVSEATLAHDLSVSDLSTLGDRRLRSMLDGEAEWVRGLPWPARLLMPLRRVLRAVRLGRHNRSHFLIVMRTLLPSSRGRTP